MALRKDGPNIKPHADKFKWEVGKKYECIMSASPAYRVGEIYECGSDEKGNMCLTGRDGLTDICHMLVSSFRVAG